MSNFYYRDGEVIRNRNGLAVGFAVDESGKKSFPLYALVVECGHCNNGYYVPMMITVYAKDKEHARMDVLENVPRLKRDRRDCIKACFEITELEKLFIESINSHDPYLQAKDDVIVEEVLERQLLLEDIARERWDRKEFERVKTADDVGYYHALERYFAPRVKGAKLQFQKSVNKDELLSDFFRCATQRYGTEIGDSYFPLLYYMQYGSKNDLNIFFENNTIMYTDFRSGEFYSLPLPENQHKFVNKYYLY